jgi:hypothetical protein
MGIVPEGSFCVPAERSRVAGFLLSGQQPLSGRHLNTLHDVGTYGKPETWSATFGYLARLRPGVSLSLGLNYTANPSQAFYFGPSKANPSQRFEGNALNFQATLFTTF